MAEKSTVVVLHGWGMSSFVTRYWCRQLRLAGYEASEFAYHSLTRTLDTNVDKLAGHIRALSASQTVHLVGHSLGGIMIMQCLSNHRFDNLGRVVMVGTPFQGSAPAIRLKATRIGHFLLGKTIVQWQGVQANDMPVGLEVGTIAGTSPIGMGRLIGRLEHPHDGTVSVKETHVPFAKDHIMMPVTHSEMLLSKPVSQQMIRFLQTGNFVKP
ncbi:MAG TPA: alpha/beta hydrolase [Burkholderiaceae bacterium]|nr:alpha/beta hydrolase [Burkholderiaceae bacterium]